MDDGYRAQRAMMQVAALAGFCYLFSFKGQTDSGDVSTRT